MAVSWSVLKYLRPKNGSFGYFFARHIVSSSSLSPAIAAYDFRSLAPGQTNLVLKRKITPFTWSGGRNPQICLTIFRSISNGGFVHGSCTRAIRMDAYRRHFSRQIRKPGSGRFPSRRGKKNKFSSAANRKGNKSITVVNAVNSSGVGQESQESGVYELYVPVPVPADSDSSDIGTDLKGDIKKNDVIKILRKYIEKNELNLLSVQYGLDSMHIQFKGPRIELKKPDELDNPIHIETDRSEELQAMAAGGGGSETARLPETDSKYSDSIPHDVRPKRTLTSTERNFITPVRAMQDFLLKSSDLAGLRKTMRRSPHADEPPITVYWRRDVEQRAEEIWGSWEELKKEKRRRGQQNEEYLDGIRVVDDKVALKPLSNIKRILKKYRKEYRPEDIADMESPMNTLLHGSGRIVLTAVTINGTNFMIKMLAWSMTGSHSLFAEAIHSLADTINQLILAYGIHKSSQRANLEHPYGYANMRHVASLISGVGIFCVGAGLSFYHGIVGLVGMEPIESLYWAFYILAGSFVSEGATLFLAVNAVRKRAKDLNITFKEFILRGRDPSLNVVILEDTAAVAGVGVAATCMALTMWTNSPIPDSVGSLVIGGLLGGVASFIIYSNSAALVGRSIPRDNLEKINAELEQDVMIRAIHDVKGIDMGNTMVRYKAEVDFDGRELTRAYLDKQDVRQMLNEVRGIKSSDDLEGFLLKHGENIVDTLGAEIDRIETRLKQSHPEIRHCDLEIL